MAAILRVGWRSFWNPTRRRTISTFMQQRTDEEVHALKAMVTWRYISLLIAIPGVLLTAYIGFSKEMAHWKHLEEHGRPEYVPYSFLAMRNKPFPWGDGNHSLVHNPRVNALPDGYED